MEAARPVPGYRVFANEVRVLVHVFRCHLLDTKNRFASGPVVIP